MTEPTKYFVVTKKAVPEVLLKVVEAKRLLESGPWSAVRTQQERADRVEADTQLCDNARSLGELAASLGAQQANICLGHLADERDYGVGAQILRELGVHKMRLLTNNPVKRVGLEAYGLEIVENVPVETVPNPYNERYLRTKKERMGHTLHFNK